MRMFTYFVPELTKPSFVHNFFEMKTFTASVRGDTIYKGVCSNSDLS